MKSMPLTQGFVTWVDDDVYEWASKYNWHVAGVGRGYMTARRTLHAKDKDESVSLARCILNLKYGDKRQADHINHDTFDNRRANLRIANNSQQHANELPRKGCTSKYKGVSWNKQRRKWEANIRNNRQRKRLGFYENEKDAARAYDKVAVKEFGEFALTNREVFPEDFDGLE